jgi:hypothetical protein
MYTFYTWDLKIKSSPTRKGAILRRVGRTQNSIGFLLSISRKRYQRFMNAHFKPFCAIGYEYNEQSRCKERTKSVTLVFVLHVIHT